MRVLAVVVILVLTVVIFLVLRADIGSRKP
jgi:hypothetical protein